MFKAKTLLFAVTALYLLGISNSFAWHRDVYCKPAVYSQKSNVGYAAYRDPCVYGNHKTAQLIHVYQSESYHPVFVAPRGRHIAYKPRAKFNRMAYVNPPPSQIFNAPRGMKHPRYDDVNVSHGTPWQYNPKAPRPSYYELRNRQALPEWTVPN